MNQRKRRSGVTLIELLIVLSLLVGVTTILSLLFQRVGRTANLETVRGSLQQQSSTATERLTRQIQQSVGVANSVASYTTDDQRLILRLASIDTQQQIIADTYDHVIYQRDPGDNSLLQEIVLPDPASSRTANTRTLARSVESFSINYTDSTGAELEADYTSTKQVSISLAFKQMSQDKTSTYELSRTVTIRNQ